MESVLNAVNLATLLGNVAAVAVEDLVADLPVAMVNILYRSTGILDLQFKEKHFSCASRQNINFLRRKVLQVQQVWPLCAGLPRGTGALL